MSKRMISFLLPILIFSLSACQLVSYKAGIYDDATHAYATAEYSRALLHYQDYLRTNPDGPKTEDAMFGIINCYAMMGNRAQLSDAIRTYNARFPYGKYQAEISNLQRFLSQTDKKRKEQLAKAAKHWKDEYAQTKKGLQQDPENAQLLLKMGHLAWNLDQYQESAEYYAMAIERKSVYLLDPLLQSRIEFDNEGNVRAKIPLGIAGSDYARLGVRIRNLRDRYDYEGVTETSIRRVFIITGTAVNETTKVIPNLSLEVTTYAANGDMLDTKIVSIGYLAPLKKRNFVIEFPGFTFFNPRGFRLDERSYPLETRDFEFFPNIDHYEIQPIY